MNQEKAVIILSGLPCTGKSHIRNDLYKISDSSFVYSTDDMLELIAARIGKTYSEVFNEFISDATQDMNQKLEVAVSEGIETIIWDQTNLSLKKRESIVKKIRELEKKYSVEQPYKIVHYSIRPPEYVEEWISFAMHSRPGKTIPENTLRDMLNRYEIPGIDTLETNVTYFMPIWRS